MREILFRAQDAGTGDWIKGFYVRLFDDKGNVSHRIYSGYAATDCEDYYPDFWEVDPETVGQFTGLTDKNGKKIFEGDVIRQTFVKSVPIFASSWGSDEYEDICGDDVGAAVIIPSKGVCIKNPIIHREVDGEITQHGEKAKMYKPVCSSRCEVIGNIHDDPELVGGAEDG